MKTCPDCAESIQDAARKCRFCGFLFEESPVAVATAAPPPVSSGTPPAAKVSRSPLPFLIVAAGGGLLGIGGIAMCIGAFSPSEAVKLISVGGFLLGGLLLAVGWACLLPRREGGLFALLGSLLILAGTIISLCLPGNGELDVLLRGLIMVGGLFLGIIGHLNTLERLGLDAARLTAFVALIGIGGELFTTAKRIELPYAMQIVLACLGLGGTALFGLALAFGAVRLWGESSRT